MRGCYKHDDDAATDGGFLMNGIARFSVIVLAGLLSLGLFPVSAATPRPAIAFPCALQQQRVICRLSGRDFYPHERVRIIYTVFASPVEGARAVAVYRRTTTTDGRGSFTRPSLWLALNRHTDAFRINATASGVRSGRVTAGFVGTP